MASANDGKYDIDWYLDQLQQSKGNLSEELSALVDFHNLTSLDVRRGSENAAPSAEEFQSPRIRNIVEGYLRNGAGNRFWPDHSLDPFFEQLQWSAETDQNKIIGLVVGLTCLKAFGRGQDVVEDAGDEAVEAEPAPTNVTNAATQGQIGDKLLSDLREYLQGGGHHKKLARKILELAEPAAEPCAKCIKANVACYMKKGRLTCVYCAARALRVRDCMGRHAEEQASSKAQPDISTAAQMPSPPKAEESATPGPEVQQDQRMSEITFLFFAKDGSAPVIEKTLSSECTMATFFDDALAAWNTAKLVAANDDSMAGVEASWDQTGTASTTPWRDQAGYDWLVAQAQEAPPSR
ncbi:hypothetical protein MMC34_005165 [Xylographa carneopallida]|nr:hypothetical protein [Xylographa carneopallida]